MPRGGKRENAGRKKEYFGGNEKDNIEGNLKTTLETLKRFVQFQCTRAETAAMLGVDGKLIDRRLEEAGTTWTEFFETHSKAGLGSLRRAQFQNALNGNTAMQIWLGKNLLDQKDKTEVGFDQDKPIRFRLSLGKQTLTTTERKTDG